MGLGFRTLLTGVKGLGLRVSGVGFGSVRFFVWGGGCVESWVAVLGRGVRAWIASDTGCEW